MGMMEVLTLLLVLITGVYVFLTFRILQSNRQSVAMMSAQMEAATRPYVVVRLERERAGFYSFNVSNLGHSAANRIQMTCDPEIKPVGAVGTVTQVGKPTDASGLFRHPITCLAPGQTIKVLFGHYSGIKASYPDLLFKIALDYDGTGRSYQETLDLSLKPTDEAQHLVDYDIGQELHGIREAIDGIRKKMDG